MDSGLTIKPAASVAQTSDVRPDPAVRKAIATDLAPSQSVTAATQAARRYSPDPLRMREIVLDPRSRDVIYRMADVRSRRVVRQVTAEARLRLRAYARPTPAERDDENGLETTV